jgi:signal transduction histidine kinase
MDSAGRMARLIDDLLNFSRISRTTKMFKKIDLNEAIDKVLNDFEEIMKEKKAKVNYRDLPVIEGIPVQMEQLFHNLLSNALKFTAKRQPVINIKSRELSRRESEQYPKLENSNKYIEITVSDNGIGFDQEYAEQIFIIFQRLNDKQSFSGTGIGLALCRKIVNNHGGQIYATSKEGEGATFHIILPGEQ